MFAEDRQAIEERKQLSEERAAALAAEAINAGAEWVRRLGEPPGAGPTELIAWRAAVATVAAYRDRYQVSSDLPLRRGAATDAQRADRRHALRAARRAVGVGVVASPVGNGVATDVRTVRAL